MPYYAVSRGRKEGVFTTWAECEQQVKKFSGAIFQKFPTLSEATDYLIKHQANSLRAELDEDVIFVGQSAAPNGLQLPIRNEDHDYLPLQTVINTKANIKKEEQQNDVMWIADTTDDKELLEAVGALREYPDTKPPKIAKRNGKSVKQETKHKTRQLKISGYVFTVDEDGYVDAYIGGHSENVGSWNCMAGYGVYFGEHHPLNVAEAASGRMTRNVGDIEAAIAAIEIAQRINIPRLCLLTSSEFLLNAVPFWLANWKRNGWRTKEGKVVQNRKQFEKLDALINEGSIYIKWTDARKEPGAPKGLRSVKKLARIGKEEYLDKHPSKDDSFSMDASNYWDYY